MNVRVDLCRAIGPALMLVLGLGLTGAGAAQPAAHEPAPTATPEATAARPLGDTRRSGFEDMGATAARPVGDTRRSGFEDMGAATRTMQRDDTQNPGMLWVAEGEALWGRKEGRAGRSCADCHDEAPQSMRGVAARYPAFDVKLARPVTLGQRIDLCRERHQQAPPLAAESAPRLALEAFVARQSRGLPISPPDDARLEPYRENGRRLFRQRIGQLDLACAQCHEENAGRRLGGSVIPQAHPTGYPIYRLEWQAVGSLQRRLRGCMTGVRAEPFAYGELELVELELFLASRAAGMPIETPAVRP